MAIRNYVRQRPWPALMGLLLACASAHADKPVMTWMATQQAPSSMPVDGKFTVGITDAITNAVMLEWPEVDHRVVVVTSARGVQNLADGQPACFHNAVFTPERERIAYYSLTLLAPPLQLITRTDSVGKLPRNAAGEVLPSTLFDRGDLRGLITPGRSYSALLDALLRSRPKNSGVNPVFLADGGANVFKMLAMDRGEYTIDYAATLAYQQSLDSSLAGTKGLIALPIAGGAPIFVGIACPRTAWGRETILKIDGILSRLATRPEYLSALMRWQTPEVLARYKKDFAAFAQQRTRLTDPEKYVDRAMANAERP